MLCPGKPPRSGHRPLRGPCLVMRQRAEPAPGPSHHADLCEQTGRMLAELGRFLDLCAVHLNLEDTWVENVAAFRASTPIAAAFETTCGRFCRAAYLRRDARRAAGRSRIARRQGSRRRLLMAHSSKSLGTGHQAVQRRLPVQDCRLACSGGQPRVWRQWSRCWSRESEAMAVSCGVNAVAWLQRNPSALAHLRRAGATRVDLFEDSATTKNITFSDLRATGITWEALAGTEPLRIQQRASHEPLLRPRGARYPSGRGGRTRIRTALPGTAFVPRRARSARTAWAAIRAF